ncbi:uncharacterized protein NPIL_548861 [Nephila pilipes]|uniref:Uncharacterized protein n=1 Tax=Nephila pilipes TaxID=299642 RepID=A0A8X6R4Z1_NEPPI|nr:uncharacterized protein NPIL_548861 [Nephila pilipes]
MYQKLWLLKLDWHCSLPEEWKEKLIKFQAQFKALETVEIPRWLHTTSKLIHLHGFCDASELAYSAVIYCYQLNVNEPQVNIMVAKIKVAPVKQISICRLELLGALLLARLFAAVFMVLPDYSISFRAWTDFSVVLYWLAARPRKWKIFVANRTSEILDIVPYEQWFHVPPKDNPADLASRDVNPEN